VSVTARSSIGHHREIWVYSITILVAGIAGSTDGAGWVDRVLDISVGGCDNGGIGLDCS